MNRRAFATLFLAASASLVRADTIAIRRPDAPQDSAPTVYSDVQVTNIAQGRVVFTTASGNEVDKALDSVVAMDIDDEPGFNQAMQDMAAQKFADATDEFDQTIQKTAKPWLKTYCEPLFTDAASKSGRFDKAVQGYINLIMNQTSIAAAHRPATPAPIPATSTPPPNPSTTPPTTRISPRRSSRPFSPFCWTSTAPATTPPTSPPSPRVSRNLPGQRPTPSPTTPPSPSPMPSSRLPSPRCLRTITIRPPPSSLPPATSSWIPGASPMPSISSPSPARATPRQKTIPTPGKTPPSPTCESSPISKTRPNAPHVADALLATASILEDHLNAGGKALRMYQSIQKQFPGTPAADQAADRISRLQSAGVQPD